MKIACDAALLCVTRVEQLPRNSMQFSFSFGALDISRQTRCLENLYMTSSLAMSTVRFAASLSAFTRAER
jgi:hypothetical protein